MPIANSKGILLNVNVCTKFQVDSGYNLGVIVPNVILTILHPVILKLKTATPKSTGIWPDPRQVCVSVPCFKLLAANFLSHHPGSALIIFAFSDLDIQGHSSKTNRHSAGPMGKLCTKQGARSEISHFPVDG